MVILQTYLLLEPLGVTDMLGSSSLKPEGSAQNRLRILQLSKNLWGTGSSLNHPCWIGVTVFEDACSWLHQGCPGDSQQRLIACSQTCVTWPTEFQENLRHYESEALLHPGVCAGYGLWEGRLEARSCAHRPPCPVYHTCRESGRFFPEYSIGTP